ncbi:hypothetical protein N9V98_07615 [Luminiphilus sp.]|nr:hypothetical protein [Luminiphilus sp.]
MPNQKGSSISCVYRFPSQSRLSARLTQKDYLLVAAAGLAGRG